MAVEVKGGVDSVTGPLHGKPAQKLLVQIILAPPIGDIDGIIPILGEDVTAERLEELLARFADGLLQRLEFSWKATVRQRTDFPGFILPFSSLARFSRRRQKVYGLTYIIENGNEKTSLKPL